MLSYNESKKKKPILVILNEIEKCRGGDGGNMGVNFEWLRNRLPWFTLESFTAAIDTLTNAGKIRCEYFIVDGE